MSSLFLFRRVGYPSLPSWAFHDGDTLAGKVWLGPGMVAADPQCLTVTWEAETLVAFQEWPAGRVLALRGCQRPQGLKTLKAP